jgi:hypothetical protein
VKLLIDEDTASATFLMHLRAAGHDIVQLPPGTLDEKLFTEAQRLAVLILTANVGRKGYRDPFGLYRLALERTPHHGISGIFRPGPTRCLSDWQIIEALNRLAAQEQMQPGTALHNNDITRLNDFLPPS